MAKNQDTDDKPQEQKASTGRSVKFILNHAPKGESNTSINFEGKAVKIKIVDKVLKVTPEHYGKDEAKRHFFLQELIKMGFKPLSE